MVSRSLDVGVQKGFGLKQLDGKVESSSVGKSFPAVPVRKLGGKVVKGIGGRLVFAAPLTRDCWTTPYV